MIFPFLIPPRTLIPGMRPFRSFVVRSSLAAMLSLLSMFAAAAGLSVDYVSNQTLQYNGYTGATNAQALDISSGKVVVLGYGYSSVLPSLWFYDMQTGHPAPPYRSEFLSMRRFNGTGTLTNFGGTIKDGRLFYYDADTSDAVQPAGGQIGMLSNTAETSATAVSESSPQFFSRNMAITGSGADTWIASVGEGNFIEARCRLFKATDSTAEHFAEAGLLDGAAYAPQGTGKAGVGLAPPAAPGLPPEWIATCDIVGGIYALRLWHRTGTDADPDFGYTLASAYPQKCVDAKFHVARTPDETSVVIALMRPKDTVHFSAELVMFSFADGQLKVLSRKGLTYEQAPYNVADRGSLQIDEASHKVYGSWNDFYINGATLNRFTLVRASYVPKDAVDLSVASSFTTSIAPQGSSIGSSHVVTNNGTHTATNVQLLLDSHWNLADVACTTSGVVSGSGGSALVEVPQLEPDAQFTVSATITADTVGTGTVTASASSTEPDANPTDNVTLQILDIFSPYNDMFFSISPATGTFFPAEFLRLNLHVHNAFDSARVEPFALTLNFSAPVDILGDGVGDTSVYVINSAIPPHDADFSIPLDLRLPAEPGISLIVTGKVEPERGDANPANNTTTATFVVQNSADLQVSLANDASSLRNGDMTSVTAFVHNAGPLPLVDITMVETVYGGAVVDYSSSASATFVRHKPQELHWLIPALQVGQTFSFDLRAVATSSTLRIAAVANTSSLPDPNLFNNSAELEIPVSVGTVDLLATWHRFPVDRYNHSHSKRTLTASVALKNPGSRSTPGTRIRFYLSNDEQWDVHDSLITDLVVPSLRPGKRKIIKLHQPVAPGDAPPFVVVYLDPGNDVPAESDEENNFLSAPLLPRR
jgi:hypothetical protein